MMSCVWAYNAVFLHCRKETFPEPTGDNGEIFLNYSLIIIYKIINIQIIR